MSTPEQTVGPAGTDLSEVPFMEGGAPSQERMVPETYRGTLVEAEHMARYIWAAKLAAGKAILDVGCGVGYGSKILSDAGANSVSGVDVDPGAILAAGESYGDTASFSVGDMLALELADDAYDLVVCFEAIEHVADPARAIAEFKRVLRDDGLLVISTPNKRAYPPGNPFHLKEMEPEEFQSILAESFGNVALCRQQDYMASVITDSHSYATPDHTELLGSEVRRMNADPREETYVVALASDSGLPAPEGLALLTDIRSVYQWFVSLEAWERRARESDAELAATRVQLHRVQNAHQRVVKRLNLIQSQPAVRVLLGTRRRLRVVKSRLGR